MSQKNNGILPEARVKTNTTSKEVMFRSVVVVHADLRTFTVFECSFHNVLCTILIELTPSPSPSSIFSWEQLSDNRTKN